MKHVYLWSTVIGAILGGIPAMYYVDDIWRMKPIQGGFEFMRWVGTVIVLLAVPVGAMCGAALAALHHVIYSIYFYFCHRSAPSGGSGGTGLGAARPQTSIHPFTSNLSLIPESTRENDPPKVV